VYNQSESLVFSTVIRLTRYHDKLVSVLAEIQLREEML